MKKAIFSKKAIKKALLYRAYSIAVSFVLALMITQSVKISVTIGIIDLIKTAFYYVFELLYNK